MRVTSSGCRTGTRSPATTRQPAGSPSGGSRRCIPGGAGANRNHQGRPPAGFPVWARGSRSSSERQRGDRSVFAALEGVGRDRCRARARWLLVERRCSRRRTWSAPASAGGSGAARAGAVRQHRSHERRLPAGARPADRAAMEAAVPTRRGVRTGAAASGSTSVPTTTPAGGC